MLEEKIVFIVLRTRPPLYHIDLFSGDFFRNIIIAPREFKDDHECHFFIKNSFCGFSHKINTCLLIGDKQNDVGFSSKCTCVRARVCMCAVVLGIGH